MKISRGTPRRSSTRFGHLLLSRFSIDKRQAQAAVGSSAFFVMAPGVVAGLIPWWLTGWQAGETRPLWQPLRITGSVLVTAGLVVLVSAFVRFIAEGRGTPAPIAPTERLVVGGLYRYVRNPMYLAVLAIIVGQACAFWEIDLLWYAVAVCIAMVSFVRLYEEPFLSSRFGTAYENYRRAVPAWRPRLRPWNGMANDERTR